MAVRYQFNVHPGTATFGSPAQVFLDTVVRQGRMQYPTTGEWLPTPPHLEQEIRALAARLGGLDAKILIEINAVGDIPPATRKGRPVTDAAERAAAFDLYKKTRGT